eukprot:765584-Hanusia_phi.AAC.1
MSFCSFPSLPRTWRCASTFLLLTAMLSQTNGFTRTVVPQCAFMVGGLLELRRDGPASCRPVVARSCREGERAGAGSKLSSLRMHESEREEKFLGSRRAARALRSLNEPRTKRKEGGERKEERFLWSRRLAKMIRSWRNENVSRDLQFASAIAEKTKRYAAVLVEEGEVRGEEGRRDDFKGEGKGGAGESSKAFRPNLPELTESDLEALRKGERVQKQMRDGRIGTGLVVVDVEADLSTVFAVLTDIDR